MGHPQLSVVRQCELLGISRSGFHYTSVGESEANRALIHLMIAPVKLVEIPRHARRKVRRSSDLLGKVVLPGSILRANEDDSAGKLFVVAPFIAPSSQELEHPANPGPFSSRLPGFAGADPDGRATRP